MILLVICNSCSNNKSTVDAIKETHKETFHNFLGLGMDIELEPVSVLTRSDGGHEHNYLTTATISENQETMSIFINQVITSDGFCHLNIYSPDQSVILVTIILDELGKEISMDFYSITRGGWTSDYFKERYKIHKEVAEEELGFFWDMANVYGSRVLHGVFSIEC